MKNRGLNYVTKVSAAYLFLLIGTCEYGASQPLRNLDFDDPAKKAYRNALKLRIGAAREILENSSKEFDKSYILNLTEIIELLVTEDPELYDQYSNNFDQRLDQMEEFAGTSPYVLFYQAEMQLQWSLVHLKFGEELSAAWNLRQAFRHASVNLREYPDFVPTRKTMGLLHVILGSVPEKYHWLLALLGLEGDINLGLAELREVVDNSRLLGDEALATLAVIESYLLQNTRKGAEMLASLLDRQPDNLLLRYLVISALIKDHRGARALDIYRTTKMDSSYLPLPFLDYLAGELYLQRGNYPTALIHYLSFIKFHPGKNYLKDAYYKISLLYWLQGKDRVAKKYRQLAAIHGVNRVESDKHAQIQLQAGEYPAPEIMKIRLLTDGGYYNVADSLINTIESENPVLGRKDAVELTYRKARLYHLTDRQQDAIGLYQQTIRGCTGESWYFGANSALQLGYLYNNSNPDLAGKFFKMAISLPKNEYENSINNKARSALKLLK